MTYAEALAELDKIAAAERDDQGIRPECRSIAMLHGERRPRVIVFWHGFTSAPPQFEPLGRLFFERGYNVYIPLQPRHGRRRMTRALQGLTVVDLQAAALRAVRIAGGLGEEIDTAGLSLGGVIAAWLAQCTRIGTVMPIAPFLALPWFSYRLNRVVTGFYNRFPNRWFWWNPFERERLEPAYAYPRYPTRTLARLLEFSHSVVKLSRRAPPLADRCVIVVNTKDPACNNSVSTHLWRQWAGDTVKLQSYAFANLDRRHDFIDPVTYPTAVELVYPVLVELMTQHADSPPPEPEPARTLLDEIRSLLRAIR
jgi:esterase/lipase